MPLRPDPLSPQDAHEFLCLLLDALHEDTNGSILTESQARAAAPAADDLASSVASEAGAAAPARSSGSHTLSDWEEVVAADEEPAAAAAGDATAAAAAAASGRASPPLEEWGIVPRGEAGEAPGGEATEVDSLVSKFMGGRICSEASPLPRLLPCPSRCAIV